MNDTGVRYNAIFPLAQKARYDPNDTVDFILSLENKKLVPASVAITGYKVILPDGTNPNPGGLDVRMDPDAGNHALFRDFTTEFRKLGLVESFNYYPRFVKEKTQATKLRNSLGTETYNCIEGKCPSNTVRWGYDIGTSYPETGADFFTLKPDIAVNKSKGAVNSENPNPGALPGNDVGTVRIRVRLAPASEALWGADVTNATTYKLVNLRLHYETVDDDGTREPITMEVYNVDRQVIETNNANLATFVEGLSDAVHISFADVDEERSLTANYLRCKPLPGRPLLSDETNIYQGAERVYYAVNDTDTALVGFTMETRMEMLWNYLRSFNNEPKNYSVTASRLNAPVPDGYGLGIYFGGYMDFSQQKFAMQIESQVSTPHSVYMYFRGMVEV